MLHPSWLTLLIIGLVEAHLIVALVTVYYHRGMSHSAVQFSEPALAIMRFLGWFTMAMDPVQFAAVHRKHHAKADTSQDPHSPQTYGLWHVLWAGVILYRKAAADPETIEHYGKQVPVAPGDAWYRANHNLGILLQGLLWVALAGWSGGIAYLLMLVWIPFWAAGVVNGMGHALGYRNYATRDTSTNMVPWGFWLSGEELHNNHHAHPADPRFAKRKWEFDLGWFYIKLLCLTHLAKVRVTPPSKPKVSILSSFQANSPTWLRTLHRAMDKDLQSDLQATGYHSWEKLVRGSGFWLREARQAKKQSKRAIQQSPRLQRCLQLEQQLLAALAARGQQLEQAKEQFKQCLEALSEQTGKAVQEWMERLQASVAMA